MQLGSIWCQAIVNKCEHRVLKPLVLSSLKFVNEPLRIVAHLIFKFCSAPLCKRTHEQQKKITNDFLIVCQFMVQHGYCIFSLFSISMYLFASVYSYRKRAKQAPIKKHTPRYAEPLRELWLLGFMTIFYRMTELFYSYKMHRLPLASPFVVG